MNLWEFLTWYEVSEANEKLDEQNNRLSQIHKQNERMRAEAKEREANEDVRETAALYEQFYRSEGDFDSVSLHKVAALRDKIWQKYRNAIQWRGRKHYVPDYTVHLWTILFSSIAIILLHFLIDKKSDVVTIIQWSPMIFMLKGFYLLIADQDRAARAEMNNRLYEKEATREAKKIKLQFPNLSPFGLYLKWYIDASIITTADLLQNSYPDMDRDAITVGFYRLFDMHTVATMDYNWYFVKSMDDIKAQQFEKFDPDNATQEELAALQQP
ncbi:MAG: hypothetical protein B5M52_03440 [Helicobacteraceae bacterium 4484_230]|nr:MAG: hypothetical protein B5M52_03440 [Helicobacteraceae bacterium 4484_230]